MIARILLSCLFAIGAIAVPAAAPTGRPDVAAAMRWRLLGPFRGGRTITATGVPGHPDRFYFGAVGGGVWKTTTAINAAHYFALKGYKVLFIDADSQGSGTQCFGYIPDNDIDDDSTLLPYLLGEITSLKPAIRSTYWDGLDLIPANLALYNAEFELPVKNIRAFFMSAIFVVPSDVNTN